MGTTEFHSGGAGKERDRFENALGHAESKKYKINHDPGMGPEYVTNHRGGKPHKKPDVTVHMSYDDDTEDKDPIGYTVHHDGAAAKDKVMHIKHIMQNDSGKFIHKKKYNMNLGF